MASQCEKKTTLTAPQYSPINLEGVQPYLKEPHRRNNISTQNPQGHEASSWVSSASGLHEGAATEGPVTDHGCSGPRQLSR